MGTLTWHTSKYKVHKLHLRYTLSYCCYGKYCAGFTGGGEERAERPPEGAGRGERTPAPHQRCAAEPDGQVQEAGRGCAQQVRQSRDAADCCQKGRTIVAVRRAKLIRN